MSTTGFLLSSSSVWNSAALYSVQLSITTHDVGTCNPSRLSSVGKSATSSSLSRSSTASSGRKSPTIPFSRARPKPEKRGLRRGYSYDKIIASTSVDGKPVSSASIGKLTTSSFDGNPAISPPVGNSTTTSSVANLLKSSNVVNTKKSSSASTCKNLNIGYFFKYYVDK